MTVRIRIQEEDFSLALEWDALRQRTGGTAGGIVAFAGLVRDHARAGEEVSGLFLEHYPDCEFIMDMLKTKAVFWKKETRARSEGTWIRSTGDDFERAKHWQDDGA